MRNVDLIYDISLLTSVPYKTLKNLCDKGNECICHSILENVKESNVETAIDIGIGQLTVVVDGDEIHYKFKPSAKLEEMLIDTISNDNDPLVTHIEQSLVSRILNTYKDLVV
jgi:hypothetical protein